MNINNFMRNLKKRFKLFFGAQENIFVIMERGVPPIYYLLYDDEEIIAWKKETIKQIREILKNVE